MRHVFVSIRRQTVPSTMLLRLMDPGCRAVVAKSRACTLIVEHFDADTHLSNGLQGCCTIIS